MQFLPTEKFRREGNEEDMPLKKSYPRFFRSSPHVIMLLMRGGVYLFFSLPPSLPPPPISHMQIGTHKLRTHVFVCKIERLIFLFVYVGFKLFFFLSKKEEGIFQIKLVEFVEEEEVWRAQT